MVRTTAFLPGFSHLHFGLRRAHSTENHWLGRRIKVFDGTDLSMPDTKANQMAWPQPSTQKPGCGFPWSNCWRVSVRPVARSCTGCKGPSKIIIAVSCKNSWVVSKKAMWCWQTAALFLCQSGRSCCARGGWRLPQAITKTVEPCP